jgi:hypothetical protein
MRKEMMMVSINKPINRRISGSAGDRGPRQTDFEYLLPCIKYKLLFFLKKKKNPKNLDLKGNVMVQKFGNKTRNKPSSRILWNAAKPPLLVLYSNKGLNKF